MFGVGEQIGGGDFAGELVEVEGGCVAGGCGPGEEFEVDLFGCGGGAPVPGGDEFGVALAVFFSGAEDTGFRAEDGGLGVVDGFAIDGKPFAHGLEAFDFGGGDEAFGVGADVEEVVAAFAGDVDEVAEEGFGGFEVGVEGLEAPGVVHGHAGLPVAAGVALWGDELLGGFGVTFVGAAEAIIPDEVGVLVEEVDDLGGAGGGHHGSGGVEPDDDGVVLVVFEELLDLRDGFVLEVVVEAAVLGGVPVAGVFVVAAADDGGASGGGPILRLGVVEAEFEALFAALFGELFEGVAVEGRGCDDVEGVDFGVEHGEAVVMFGGDDDVLHAGGFGEGDDVVCVEAGGVELFGEGLVVGDGDGEVVHDPLADVGGALSVPLAGGDGVEAPVDEHAEAGLAPPGHAGVALGGSFGVLDGGDGMLAGGGDAVALKLGGGGGAGGEEEGGSEGAVSEIQESASGWIGRTGIVCEK